MKAKYIFTKFGYRRSDLEVSDIVPEIDPDYDVADVFLTDKYSSDGESICFEAESLEEAVYFANRYFSSCVSPKNIALSYECSVKFLDLALVLDDPDMLKRINEKNIWNNTAPYVPAPVKIDTNWGTFFNKRYRKFYQKHKKTGTNSPSSLIFNYGTSWCRA